VLLGPFRILDFSRCFRLPRCLQYSSCDVNISFTSHPIRKTAVSSWFWLAAAAGICSFYVRVLPDADPPELYTCDKNSDDFSRGGTRIDKKKDLGLMFF
jgi:hypothetical protein